jgi:hypothetical protein
MEVQQEGASHTLDAFGCYQCAWLIQEQGGLLAVTS